MINVLRWFLFLCVLPFLFVGVVVMIAALVLGAWFDHDPACQGCVDCLGELEMRSSRIQFVPVRERLIDRLSDAA